MNKKRALVLYPSNEDRELLEKIATSLEVSMSSVANAMLFRGLLNLKDESGKKNA